MSKIDRNIDAYDRLMLRTSQLKECQEELTALRSWKAKARPFLENIRQTNQAIINEGNYNCMDDELEQEIQQLTELLGGSDERND